MPPSGDPTHNTFTGLRTSRLHLASTNVYACPSCPVSNTAVTVRNYLLLVL